MLSQAPTFFTLFLLSILLFITSTNQPQSNSTTSLSLSPSYYNLCPLYFVYPSSVSASVPSLRLDLFVLVGGGSSGPKQPQTQLSASLIEMAFPHFRDYGDQAQYTFSTSDSYSTTRRSSLENPNRPVGSLSRGHSTLSHHHLRHTPVSNYFPPTSRRGSASGAANNHRESTNNYRAHASGGDGAGGGPSGRVQGGGRLDPPVDQDFMSETNTISRHGSIIPQLLETPPEFGHLKSRPIVQEDYSTSSLNVEYENHQDGNGGGHGGHRARFNAQNLRDLEAQVDKPIRPSLREIGGRLHGSSAADKGRGKSYSKEEIREEKRTTVSAEELDAGKPHPIHLSFTRC